MSCTPARRVSYQLDVERQEAAKGGAQSRAAARTTADDDHTPEPDQQQPSPLVVRKAIKRAAEDDDSDGDNNQEEEVAPTPVAVPFSLHRRLFSREDPPQEPKLVPTVKVEKKSQQIHHLRKQAVLNSDPPLTTARLRQENAALKLKLSQLGNQHETQMQAIQYQLAQALTAHEKAEQTLKTQILQLEKRHADSNSTLQKCQVQVESLLEKLREVEIRSERIGEQPERRALCPSTPSKATTLTQSLLLRRGNGSPLPYGKQAKLGSVQPFAWRDTTNHVRVHIAHEMLASPSPKSADATPNKYRMSSFSSSPTTPVTARYVPVVPQFPECGSLDSPVNDLPSPFTLKHQRPVPLEKKLSAGLLSYCADVFSSKFSQASAPSPSPSMKVMPAWKVEEVLKSGFNSSPARVDKPLPGDFTAINMPPMSFSGGEASPVKASI